jgi:hypothetical protein
MLGIIGLSSAAEVQEVGDAAGVIIVDDEKSRAEGASGIDKVPSLIGGGLSGGGLQDW